MNPRRMILKAALCTVVLAMTISGVFWAPSSVAFNTAPARQDDKESKGTIVAHLKYEPTVFGYGFRNYGRDHDNENDLSAVDLLSIFVAENLCQSGSTAEDCVLYEPAEEWLASQV